MSVVRETWLPRHRFNADEDYRMKGSGILRRGGEYTKLSSTQKPGVVALTALPELTVDLSDLFG
jgi:hypothetical protein